MVTIGFRMCGLYVLGCCCWISEINYHTFSCDWEGMIFSFDWKGMTVDSDWKKHTCCIFKDGVGIIFLCSKSFQLAG